MNESEKLGFALSEFSRSFMVYAIGRKLWAWQMLNYFTSIRVTEKWNISLIVFGFL